MGKGSIDLGLPTEDKPEWTISLDFVEKENEREVEETISPKPESIPAPAMGAPEPSFSNQGSSASALDSGFILDGAISSPASQPAEGTGGLSGALDASNTTIQAPQQTQEDSITTLGGGLDGNISSDLSVASDTVLGGGLDVGEAGMLGTPDTMIQAPQQPQEESITTLGGGLDVGEAAAVEPEAVEQPAQTAVPDELEKEKDEVEERLNHLANSMDDWEQSEKALSEAAAMLSSEKKAPVGENEADLKNLFERLDISDNLNRMNATVQEDLADVIEQTKEDELLEAESVMPDVEPIQTESVAVSVEPIQAETAAPSPEPAAAPTGEMEITNDMFDLGIDLSEEDNFSDENIDLNSFKGSIEDAEEFNAPPENSIDLDGGETASGSSNSGLDMSNLVAAALNDLSGGSTQPAETTETIEPAVESQPETEENTLTFDTGIEPETNELETNELEINEPETNELSEGSLEFMTGAEEIQTESSQIESSQTESGLSGLDESAFTFDTGVEPETTELETNEPETNELSEGSLEFNEPDTTEPEITEPAANEPETNTARGEDISEFTVPQEPVDMGLKFEPVYPEEETSSSSNIIDDIAGDDITSMIIEDYSEVPTVSGIENKLNKQEKEKKRNKSKESKQNKEDGFAYSLEDIPQSTEDLSQNPVVEAALEAANDIIARKEAAAAREPEEPTQAKRRMSTQHIVHKNGKMKRSYYKLFYV
ncbi:MAG: hypothetical protein NC293_01005 [Roseburia sp.]|nr:hypothetical protein [Roseburia sp.]